MGSINKIITESLLKEKKVSDDRHSESNTIKFFLGIIAFAIIVIFLKELKSIFIPLTFALFMSFMFQPFIRFLQKRKIPLMINIILIVIIILFLFTALGTVIYTSVSSFVTDFPKYEKQITSMVSSYITKFEIPAEQVKSYLQNKVNWLQMAERLSLSKIVSGTMGNFIDFFIKLLLTVAFMVFILLERSRMFKSVEKVVSENGVLHFGRFLNDIETQIKTYVINKTLISLATGLVSMFFIAIFRIDFVVMSGLLIFILNYIPNIGSIVASAFPILICFVQYGFSWQLIAITTTLIAIQMTIGNFVEPKVMGTGLKLSPIIVLISLIFWYWVWGPVGMILAVPITSAINLVLKEIPSMKVVSALISSD
ncbi:MAG: AI-2E family transporter [Candidatus Cloacimonetes bacterium]|nr:AI-2E family transporter [Candidatus Cloacimonadota bacterium]